MSRVKNAEVGGGGTVVDEGGEGERVGAGEVDVRRGVPVPSMPRRDIVSNSVSAIDSTSRSVPCLVKRSAVSTGRGAGWERSGGGAKEEEVE
jgi:hypothetical protein